MAEASGDAGQTIIEPDDLVDEGFAESSASSLLSTVPSEISRLKEEHGRLWATHGTWICKSNIICYVYSIPR